MGYLELLRATHVLRLLTGTLTGRLPSAMATLAIPLALREAGASYGFVGIATGTFAIATAVGGPLLGRAVDHVGQPKVLVPTAVLAGMGFTLIGVVPGKPAWVLVGAALAGVATPPLEPCLRVLWPRILPAARLDRAYALDAGAQELVFVGAPLMVAGTVAVTFPAMALWLAALLGALGVLIVVTAAPSREYRAEERAAHWLGPLRSRGLVVLLTGLVGTGVAIGTLNVLVIFYAEQHRLPGGAGTLLALNAAGALVGALGYGALRWEMPLPRRGLLLAGGMTIGYGLLILLPAPPLMAVLMILTGLFLAPLLTVSFVLVDRLAPPGTVTEAFAWLITVFTSGIALGAAVAGAVIERASPTWAAVGGALATVGTVVVLLAGRNTLAGRVTVPATDRVPA
ncbi:MFS transporter [Micromonospora inyonensis]|uniref:Predicted arabinose efflux permease, MFS family n=1 Tax=Micromonospora inyonensis TaxID=47866 RepID=A0A1C6RNE2_9ACTN|nr:MFS transporter [Micromonospora inyonensis]SCL18571.1 Predicted arabinose efflux permease, MFS family [Micromonospora inyonensis]